MGKKATKASRKLAAKGEIKRQIQARHKNQKLKKRLQSRKVAKEKTKEAEDVDTQENGREEEDSEDENIKNKLTGMSVDNFLEASFLEKGDGEVNYESEEFSHDGASDNSESSFASVDDLSDEGESHMHELAQLAETDPEFYKYIQENDRELLEFNPHAVDVGDDGMGGDEDIEVEERLVLTSTILKGWQRALLNQYSLRALRKLLVAFRTVAHVQDEDDAKVHLFWRIDDPAVYQKLVTTALRYTPVVLDHHIPYKKLSNDKFKQPSTSKKFSGLTKLLLSHFHNIIRVIEFLPKRSSEVDSEGGNVQMTVLALQESAKLLPYVVGSRKAIKLYLKTSLDLWSSAEDNVRMAAFLAVRRLASANDEGVVDLVLKGSYLTLVRSSKSISTYTLPNVTLMKNTATELYCLSENETATYQHAFRYIRQLAILLRGGMKSKTKEAYRQVYNWQFVQCIDFWTLVLARACSKDTFSPTTKSDLHALIYPLVQISLGAIQLNPTPRSFPFHLQLLQSVLHLCRHTETYIPLAPQLFPIILYALSPNTSGKASTLRPILFDTTIRAPAPYLRTRIYAESLAEEGVYIMAEWLAMPQIQGSIAFPEISVPLSITLKKAVKSSKGGKATNEVKTLVEKLEEGAKWVEERRGEVNFAPRDTDKVKDWEEGLRKKVQNGSPFGKAVKVMRKARERRKKLLDKAREGENEFLED